MHIGKFLVVVVAVAVVVVAACQAGRLVSYERDLRNYIFTMYASIASFAISRP